VTAGKLPSHISVIIHQPTSVWSRTFHRRRSQAGSTIQGVIKHFTIETDPEKLGLTTSILILIRLHPKPIKEFVKDVQCPELQDPRVLSLYTVAHPYNKFPVTKTGETHSRESA
jgi:hypothetical protein